ncbi:MAG: hypothetical protein SPK23_01480 [Eubacteriales bacterium]|nr:hypothetical protein [Eubacteriales bacterium]
MKPSTRRLVDALSVVDYDKRAALKNAIEQGKRILLHGKTKEGEALIQKLEDYKIPYIKLEDTYFFEERSK